MLHSRYRRHQLISVTLKGNAVEKAHGVDSDVNAGSRELPLLAQVIKSVPRSPGKKSVLANGDNQQPRDVSAVRLLRAFCAATNGKISDVFRS